MDGEFLFSDTFYLSLIMNSTSFLTWDDTLEIENFTLRWLKDNIGSPDSFTPTCLYTSEYDGAKVSCDTDIDGSPLNIAGWAFKMVVFYAVQEDYTNQTFFFKPNKCGDCDTPAPIINKNQKDKEKDKNPRKEWNKKNSQITHHSRLLYSMGQEGDKEKNLNDTDFRIELAEDSGLDIALVGALPSDEELSSFEIARCGSFYYGSKRTQFNSYWYCSQFAEYSCGVNDFIDYNAWAGEICTDMTWNYTSWDDYWTSGSPSPY